MLFSNRHACPSCGYSVPLLEPKMFSFNNPSGACPTCDGLGYQEFFDPARVVAHPNLSLASGAIRGWDRRNAYYFQMIQSLAKHYRFDIEAPFESLPQAVRDVVLHGSTDAPSEPESRAKLARALYLSHLALVLVWTQDASKDRRAVNAALNTSSRRSAMPTAYSHRCTRLPAFRRLSRRPCKRYVPLCRP